MFTGVCSFIAAVLDTNENRACLLIVLKRRRLIRVHAVGLNSCNMLNSNGTQVILTKPFPVVVSYMLDRTHPVRGNWSFSVWEDQLRFLACFGFLRSRNNCCCCGKARSLLPSYCTFSNSCYWYLEKRRQGYLLGTIFLHWILGN